MVVARYLSKVRAEGEYASLPPDLDAGNGTSVWNSASRDVVGVIKDDSRPGRLELCTAARVLRLSNTKSFSEPDGQSDA